MFALFLEILQQTEKGDIEMLACLVRKYFGEDQIYAPRLRVGDLLRSAGISFRQDNIPGFARMEAWDEKGQYRILCSLNSKIKNPYELNFALAHMLGHVFLDLHPKMAKGELQQSIFEEKVSPLHRFLNEKEARSKAEVAADSFASAMLLPSGMLKKAMSKLSAASDVAAFFHVDLAFLEARLRQLGIERSAASSSESANTQKVKPTAPAPLAPQAPAKQSAGDPSSMTRVKKNVAALSYRREEQRSEASKPEDGSKGIERLRKLAKKIDKSVDV